MSSRSYLSIGDVLTLLRQEFPDVTISKIRFLESQGLVNPERTPSGYRKFYEHDVERLRWVLRQQREHFLPLKVIKDRLDDDDGTGTGPAPDGGADGAEGAEGAVPVAHPAPVIPSAEPAEVAPEVPVLVGRVAVSGVTALSAATHLASAETTPDAKDGATLPGIEPVHAHAAPTNHRGPASPADGPVAAGAPSGRAGPSDSPAPEPTTPPAPARKRAAAKAAAAAATPPVAKPEVPEPAPASVDLTGASLSIDELSAACGLEPTVIRELEAYGLLCSMTVAGLECFDEEALAVARVAARFAAYGIEPRHLRLYKNAADREAGFVEQIVIPLVRQRNPEARARAQDTADELTRLGQQLRGSLLRNALRDLLQR